MKTDATPPRLGIFWLRPPTALAATLAIAVALGVSMPADAQDITGSRLLEFCGSDEAPDLALCHGFFRGLSDTHSIYAAMGKGLHLYCLPKGITQEQFEKVAFKWMEANTEHLERPAAVLIVQALHEGFPCDENGENPAADKTPPAEAPSGGEAGD